MLDLAAPENELLVERQIAGPVPSAALPCGLTQRFVSKHSGPAAGFTAQSACDAIGSHQASSLSAWESRDVRPEDESCTEVPLPLRRRPGGGGGGGGVTARIGGSASAGVEACWRGVAGDAACDAEEGFRTVTWAAGACGLPSPPPWASTNVDAADAAPLGVGAGASNFLRPEQRPASANRFV